MPCMRSWELKGYGKEEQYDRFETAGLSAAKDLHVYAPNKKRTCRVASGACEPKRIDPLKTF